MSDQSDPVNMASISMVPPPREPARQVGYIVVFKASVADVVGNVRGLSQRYSVPVHHVYDTVMKGFATRMPQAAAEHMRRAFPNVVESVEPDLEVTAFAQTVPWGMTRVGTTASTCSAMATSSTVGIDVHAFIFDTGVQKTHPDLKVVEALSFVPNESTPEDGNGHGTAVSGVVGAVNNTQYVLGVAPGARLHSYKVMDRTGSGSFSAAVAGIDRMLKWKAANPSVQNRIVANFSFGAYVGTSAYNLLDSAIVKATLAGITCVVAAGNSGDDSTYYSPAHTAEAITVGAYDAGNVMPQWSNFGACVDVLAPGVNILTTYPRNKTVSISGTSFSSPHVAGAAALYLAKNPGASPAAVCSALVALAANTYGGANPDVSVAFPSTTRRSMYVKDL